MIDFVDKQEPAADRDEQGPVVKGREVVYCTSNSQNATALADFLGRQNQNILVRILGRFVIAIAKLSLVLALPALAAATQNEITERLASVITCSEGTEAGLLSVACLGLCILALIRGTRR